MLRLALNAVCWVIVATIPALGAWVASSLAAYWNGPPWAAALAGLLGFPVLPLAWELWAYARRPLPAEEKKDAAKRRLGLGDRLILRTLVVNALFLTVLLASAPQAGFTALAARGDWMLDGRSGPGVERARAALFWTADRLEWLYAAARDNPYAALADVEEGEGPPPLPASGGDPDDDETAEPPDPADAAPDPPPDDDAGGAGPAEPLRAGQPPRWPFPAEPHPLAREVPPAAQGRVADVAAFVAEREPDPVKRFKALHDFVALRTAYDAKALAAGRYPPQDPATVLKTRLAVCAGYANLLQALGEAADLDVAVVTGDSRDMGGGIAGGGHAWNAVELGGRWYLVDATWNAGHLDGGRFVAGYGTEYLFTPPAVFAVDHLPDDPRWQLLAEPVSRGAFTRQPLLRPGFHAAGLKLLWPDRSQVTAAGPVRVKLANPGGAFVLAQLVPKGAAGGERLEVAGEDPLTVEVADPGPGAYQVHLFVNDEPTGSYAFCGQVEVLFR